ncbi:MAG TPA: UDP-N-acetylmuramate dehydrogenase [Parvibaculum sp.]|uniref:UDP-N-acetylmuramate dehydrogenase n=1 Tax=Parvibaculum sp. TaxID=2024848 RepID=UPI002C6D3CA5|nr:UDP-N-acetylmuramate dehydrogenase [Parvibaculum sp.]HMM14860.1 UDP-N-acetylmuramate dehydrogenase [Parvibaculum sp.]
MMAAHAPASSLIERLPRVRGELVANAPLAPFTWFRVGGPAEVLFRPADADDLAAFLAGTPTDVPVTVIGVGSNLLVRDGGVAGVVIRLGGKGFSHIEALDGHRLRAGTAALDVAVARAAQEAGIAGLEFYRGIPGSIGGALRMNGGAYGRETKDVLVEAVAIDRQGRRQVLSNADMGYSYRHCGAPEDLIFVEAIFQGEAGDKAEIQRRMDEITAKREESQPIRMRTGGSTFKNPEGHKSWQLIDAAGCRGLVRGGAQVSELHCNFLINTGTASAADLEGLGEEVRARVKAKSGVVLEWEIRRIGEPA